MARQVGSSCWHSGRKAVANGNETHTASMYLGLPNPDQQVRECGMMTCTLASMTHRGGCSAGSPGEDGGGGDAVVPAQHGPSGTADQGAGHVVGGGVNAAGPRGAVAGAANVAQAIGALQLTSVGRRGKAVATCIQ